jgi:hypothetical protein
VPQAGVYPFRLLYYQGAGGAQLRWLTVNRDGSQTLLNDLEQPTALAAFRSVTTVDQPSLSVARSGADAILTWQGTATLESASAVNGPWSTVNGAASPYRTTPSQTQFFRLRQ